MKHSISLLKTFYAFFLAAFIGALVVIKIQGYRLADAYYSQCWKSYYIQNEIMLREYDEGAHGAVLMNFAEVFRKDLYDMLQDGAMRYPDHPSLNQLLYLLSKDSVTYSYVMPEWLTDAVGGLDGERIMNQDRYLVSKWYDVD